MEQRTTSTQSWAVPIAIVLGFGLIASAIYFSGGGGASSATKNANGAAAGAADDLSPVSLPDADDHIRGNPNAPIVMVEFSDFDCPFCKRFHTTMNSVIGGRYGQNGDLAWVYRHLPIQNLHPNAPAVAHASECVAEQGGNELFWEFNDLYFEGQGEVEDVDVILAQLDRLDADAYTACMDESRYVEKIQSDMNEAANAGGTGTPFSVFVFAEPISESVRAAVRSMNTQIKNQTGMAENSFVIISDTQVSMNGALGAEYINQLLSAYKGISLE